MSSDKVNDYDVVDMLSVLDDDVALASGDEWYVDDSIFNIKTEMDVSGKINAAPFSDSKISSNTSTAVAAGNAELSSSKKRRRQPTSTRPPNPAADIIRLATEEGLKNLNLDPNSTEGKMRKKQIRNRMSAQLHRENKKVYIGTLEEQLKDRDDTISTLQHDISELISENRQLRQQLGLPVVDYGKNVNVSAGNECNKPVTPAVLTENGLAGDLTAHMILPNISQAVNILDFCGLQTNSTDGSTTGSITSAHTSPLNSSSDEDTNGEDDDEHMSGEPHDQNAMGIADGLLHSQMAFHNHGNALLAHVKDGKFIPQFHTAIPPQVQNLSNLQQEHLKFQQQYHSVSPSPGSFGNARGLALFSAAVVFLFGFSLLGGSGSIPVDSLSNIISLPSSSLASSYPSSSDQDTDQAGYFLAGAPEPAPKSGHIIVSKELEQSEKSSDSSSYRLFTAFVPHHRPTEDSNVEADNDMVVSKVGGEEHNHFALVSYFAAPPAPIKDNYQKTNEPKLDGGDAYNRSPPPLLPPLDTLHVNTFAMYESVSDQQLHGLWRYNTSNAMQLYPWLGEASRAQTGSFYFAEGNASHTDPPAAMVIMPDGNRPVRKSGKRNLRRSLRRASSSTPATDSTPSTIGGTAQSQEKRISPPSTTSSIIGGRMQEKRLVVSPTAQESQSNPSNGRATSVYVSRVLLSEGKALLHPTLFLSTLPFADNQTVNQTIQYENADEKDATGAREGYGAAGFAQRDRKLGKAVVVAHLALPHTSEGVPDTDSSTTHMVTMLIPASSVQWGTSWGDNGDNRFTSDSHSAGTAGNSTSQADANNAHLEELFRRYVGEGIVDTNGPLNTGHREAAAVPQHTHTSSSSHREPTGVPHHTHTSSSDDSPLWVEISCHIVKARLVKNVTPSI